MEELFQQGLLKVVFATETLAAGINMPARTTVISSISRRRNGVYAPLPHNDLLQMAGRAGRRGYDTQGHCVITQTRHAPLSTDQCITPPAPLPPIGCCLVVCFGVFMQWPESLPFLATKVIVTQHAAQHVL